MPCIEQIKINGVNVDSQLQPVILSIMKDNPHLVLERVNSFNEEYVEHIDDLKEHHYEDVAGREYNYFTDESFNDEFGDWQNDNNPDKNKFSNGEPRLFLDKNLNKHYYRTKYNDKVFFPLTENGLHYIYDEESINEGVKFIAYRFFQSNFNNDYSNMSFIANESFSENVRQIIMSKINETSDTDQDYIADELRESLYYLDEWVERTQNYFKNLGFKIKETDAEIQYEEENDTQELIKKSSVEYDSKRTVSSNIKAFLSFIPNPESVDLVFEESGFVEFEDIYNTLQNGLSDISPTIVQNNIEDTYNIMVSRINELSVRKPYLKELVNILNHPSLTQDKKSEFTQAFNLIKNPYFVTEIDFNDNNISYTNKNVNQVNANFNVIKREWGYNFEEKFTENGKFLKNKLREVNDDIKIIRSKFDKLKRTTTEINDFTSIINDVVITLRELGVETTEAGFNSAIDNLGDGNSNLSDVIENLDNFLGKVQGVIKEVGDGKKPLFKNGKFKNPFSDESVITNLAKEEAFIKPDGSDATIFSSGKSLWVYSLPSHIVGELNKWKSNIDELEAVYNLPNGKSSKILQYLLAYDQGWVSEDVRKSEAKKRIDKYQIGIFNALQAKKKAGVKSDAKSNTEVSKNDSIVDTINRALLSKKKGQTSLFNTPTPADKSTSYLLSHGYFLDSNINTVEDGKVIVDNKKVTKVFFDYFSNEYDRMIKAAEVINDPASRKYVYYHTDKSGNTHKNGKVIGNAFKSQIFEGLSFDKMSKVLPEIAEIIYNDDGTPAVNSIEEFKEPISEYIKNILAKSIDEKMLQLESFDIIQKNPNVKGDFSAKGIDAGILASYKTNYAFPVHNAVADYHINTMINNIEYSKMFSGDPAYYKNMVDYAKRIPATYTDGMQLRLLNNDELTFNAAIITGVEIGSKYMKELKELVGDDIARWYADGAINSTDAQAWITPKRWEFLIKRLGIWTDYHETALPKILGDSKEPFTEKEMKAVAQPVKGVYFKMNGNVPTYLKYSQAVLIPDLVKGSDLERMYDKMVENDIDEVITLDGIKVGAPVTDTIHDDNGMLLNDFNLTPLPLDNRGWKLQQNLPTKTFKNTDIGSQIQKNVLSGLAFNMDAQFNYEGNTITGQELYKNINNIIGALVDKGMKNLTNELNLDEEGRIQSPQALYKLLLDEAKKRNVNDNLMKALQKEISIYGIPQSHSKLMNMFFSIVKDRVVKIKTNGGSFIQVSNFGIDKLTDSQKTGVKWFIDPKKGLKPPHFAVDENGNHILSDNGKKIVKPGQILLPGSFLTKYIPNWKTLHPSVLKDMIDPKILENVIGYRIPNQGLSSNDPLEIVGILPEGMGDAVVAYSEIPMKTGSDFDIDKMYLMLSSFKMEYDKLTRPIYDESKSLNEQTSEVLQNKLIDAYRSVFLHPEVIKDVMTPIDFDYIKKDITTIFDDSGQKSDLYHFDSINQTNLKYDFIAGKAGVGQTANMLVDHVRGMFINMAFTGTYIGWGHKNDLNETLLDREYSEDLNNIDSEYISKLLKLNINDVKNYKISHSISAFLNAFVDIAKDPYVTRGNWNTQTSNTGFMMLRAGVHPFKVNRFIGQPIIKEFAEFVSNAESKYQNEQGDMRKLFLEHYKKKYNTADGNIDFDISTVSLEELDDMIKNPNNRPRQLKIINKFFELQDLSKKLALNIKAVKPDVSAGGKDLADRFIIENLINHINEKEKSGDIGEIKGFQGKLIDPSTNESTFLGHYVDGSVKWADKIIKNNPKIFLLGNKTIENTFNALSNQLRNTRLLSSTMADRMYADFYTYTMSGFDGLKQDKAAMNLFIKLPKKVIKLKESNPNNFFLNQLEIIKEDGLTFIRLQNKKRSKNIQNKLYMAWRELLLDNDSTDIAKSLIKYSFYQSGFQNNINEFFSHIPHEYFVDTKLNQYIHEVSGELKDIQTQFIDQFFQHNWEDPLFVPNLVGKTVKVYKKNVAYTKVNPEGLPLPPYGMVKGNLVKLAGYTSKHTGVYVITNKLGISKINGGIVEYSFNNDVTRSQFKSNNISNSKEISKFLDKLTLPYGPSDLNNELLIDDNVNIENDFNFIEDNDVVNDNNTPDLFSKTSILDDSSDVIAILKSNKAILLFNEYNFTKPLSDILDELNIPNDYKKIILTGKYKQSVTNHDINSFNSHGRYNSEYIEIRREIDNLFQSYFIDKNINDKARLEVLFNKLKKEYGIDKTNFKDDLYIYESRYESLPVYKRYIVSNELTDKLLPKKLIKRDFEKYKLHHHKVGKYVREDIIKYLTDVSEGKFKPELSNTSVDDILDELDNGCKEQ